MRSDWIDHDGLDRPRHAPVIEVEVRDPGRCDVLWWDWAQTGAIRSGDVLRYRLGNPWPGGDLTDVPVGPPDAVARQYLKRADVLDAARQAVTVDRAATHGGVEDSFNRIAAIWSVHLGVPVTGAQVALLLAELKVVRAWGNPTHTDNWCDLAGYAACGGELSGAEKP